MKEIIEFDNESLRDILDTFAILVDRFNKYHLRRVIKGFRANTPIVLSNAILIEIHSKYYIIHYKDCKVVMDSRTARRYFGERRIVNFVRVSKNYRVNLAYIEYVNQYGDIKMKYIKELIKISDSYKDKLI